MTGSVLLTVSAIAVLGLMTACTSDRPTPTAAASALPGVGGPVSAGAANDSNWTMAPGDYANTRFSGLADINTGNAGSLQEAWSFSTGVLGGHEAAPIVVGGTMFIVTPFPNTLYALDLTNGVGFVDVGNVWQKVSEFSFTDLRKTAGVGLRLRTKWVLVRGDYGRVLDRRDGERRGRFYFSIGQAF